MNVKNVKSEGSSFSIFNYSTEKAGRGPILWGFALLIPLLLTFGAWAAIAPINAAAIADGAVVLNDDRKTVQHLEGGIIDEILIKEAEIVNKDDPILVIRDVGQRTQIDTLYDQLSAAKALNIRLVAERDGQKELNFISVFDGLEVSRKVKNRLINSQTSLFNSRKKSVDTKVELIEAKKVQTRKEIEGLIEQLVATTKQLELSWEEFSSIEPLYEKSLTTLTRKMEMEKAIADFEGQVGSLKANIARLEQTILAADIEIVDLENENMNSVLDELQQNELTIQELTHQLKVISDQLDRTIIKAPVTGKVLDLKFHTKGAVISPGERILDLVPVDDRLIIEARLNPNDIDIVTTGTTAKVLLSAYKAKKVPKLDGEVINVSADIFTDEGSGERYFLARVLVDDSIFEDLKNEIELYPGMPTQVFFLAGERTVADYLFAPIIDATYRAFREE